MKQLCKLLILILFAMVTLQNTVAGTPSKSETKPKRTVRVDRLTSAPNLRPQAPSRQFIDCFYENEQLFISFAIPEGEGFVTVTDCDSGSSETFTIDTSICSDIFIGDIESAVIDIQTSKGYLYQGILE